MFSYYTVSCIAFYLCFSLFPFLPQKLWFKEKVLFRHSYFPLKYQKLKGQLFFKIDFSVVWVEIVSKFQMAK